MALGLFSCSPSSPFSLLFLNSQFSWPHPSLPHLLPRHLLPHVVPHWQGTTLAIFTRLSQEPTLTLRFWNETDLNMNLKLRSLSTTYWAPVGAFTCITHEAGLKIRPRRAVFSAPQMPAVFTEQATMRKVIYASKGPATGSPKTQGPLELTSSHTALM